MTKTDPTTPHAAPARRRVIIAGAGVLAVVLGLGVLYGTNRGLGNVGAPECPAAQPILAAMAPLAHGEVAAVKVNAAAKPLPALSFSSPEGKPMTLADHQASRMVVDPLRLFDCCLITDGAAVAIVTSAARARDLKQRPVYISGMQGLRAGRDEFIFAPRGLGINQQRVTSPSPDQHDLQAYRMAGITRADLAGLYTYDAFSPLVLFTLERFGFCEAGEAAAWVQGGRIELGGELPMNTSGGLLSEAHVGGWNSILEIVRQLRGSAGVRQIEQACHLQWATAWGDSVIFRN